MSLSRTAGPLYRQVAEDLEESIGAGEFPPGSQLPSEAELAGRYGVHRLTVRQALSELARTGLIRTIHGRGSFVAAPPVPYEVSPRKAASLTRLLEEQGLHSTQRLLGRLAEAPREVAGSFAGGARLVGYEQLRLVDGEPWSLTVTWLDTGRFPGLEEHWDGTGSLFQALTDGYSVVMHRTAVTFWAELARPEESRLLQVSPGAPLLVTRGSNADAAGATVAIADHRFRGDRVRFTVDLAE